MEDKPVESPPTKKKTSLTPQDFTIKYRLGKGAYGDVFLVVKNNDRKMYAMKQIQKKKLERQQKEYHAMVQKQLLTNLKHPGIVKLRSSFQDKQNLYFVLEYCEGGQFVNFIKSNIQKLHQNVKTFYIAQIVNLLQYLHKNGITHRDLKPQNLMLDKRGHLKLIDFGTAQITNASILKPQFKQHILKLKQKAEQLRVSKQSAEQDLEPTQSESPLKKRRSTFVGTCYFISPELLEQNYCPPSADLWALGCIIYQLYYLETPFKDNYQFAVFEKIKKAEINFPKNEVITDEAIDLIKKLLVKNPQQRLGSGTTQDLSYSKLKAHPYFKGLDIDNIFNLPVPYMPGIHMMQNNEHQSLEAFKQQTEKVLKKISEQNQIIKHQIVEQKTFITYNYALLVYCNNNKLFLVSSQDVQKRRAVNLNAKSEKKIKLQNTSYLILQQQDRITQLRSACAQQWFEIISKI